MNKIVDKISVTFIIVLIQCGLGLHRFKQYCFTAKKVLSLVLSIERLLCFPRKGFSLCMFFYTNVFFNWTGGQKCPAELCMFGCLDKR